jgi:hypothetical protein
MNDTPRHDSSASEETSAHPPSYLFTVRLWPERSAQGVVTWRGKVQTVPNGAWCYFQEWNALTAFLQTQVEELAGER